MQDDRLVLIRNVLAKGNVIGSEWGSVWDVARELLIEVDRLRGGSPMQAELLVSVEGRVRRLEQIVAALDAKGTEST